jgi:hypothetical protein
VSNGNFVHDFQQLLVPWSDHDMIFISCQFRRSEGSTIFKNIRSFRSLDSDEVLAAAETLDWRAVWSFASVEEKVDCFYSMLTSLADFFAPTRKIKVKENREENEDLHSISNWCDEEVQQAIAQRDEAYSVWQKKSKFWRNNHF